MSRSAGNPDRDPGTGPDRMRGTWHYVRPNETSRQPRHHVFLDVEATAIRTGKSVDQRWGVAVTITRAAPKGGRAKETLTVHENPRALWEHIEQFVPRRGRAVLWAHNLGYDVRVSRALDILPRMGWRLESHNLTPGSTWLLWRRADRSLSMVDSMSVFPVGLDALAPHFGRTKPPLPPQDAPRDQWVRRCVADATILRDAIVAYLARLEEYDLGNWQLTGTGQAWAAFRHRFLTHQMLVHWDEDARDAERTAMWTGRCEAYWHGSTQGVRVDEWDMTLSYPRIAANRAVPVALVAPFAGDRALTRWLDRDGYVVLAEVDVHTDVPTLPAMRDGRVCWPVGSFRTTVWDPELILAMQRGARVSLVRGWAYRAEPALAEWAAWVMDELDAPESASPAWWKIVTKHWARAVIGRMAMSYREWEHVGTSPRMDIRRSVWVDADTGQSGETVQVGRDLWLATESVPWAQSMPAVTGYIQSAARELYTRLWLDLGDRVAIYGDTDSLLVPEDHAARMAALVARHPEGAWRLKRSWRGCRIMGPRQIVTGPRVRASGVPRGAVAMPNGTLVGQVWESLPAALGARRATSVRITPRVWSLRGVDHRRVAGADGWTVPHRLG